MKNKKMTFLTTMVTAGMILSCAPATSYAKTNMGKIQSIQVTNLPAHALTLKKGKSKKLKVAVKSTKKISKAVGFKTSNKKIVTVKNGKIKAIKNGKANVTVYAKANNKKKIVIHVTVGTPVTKVTLNQTNANVEVGKTLDVKAKVDPKKASNKKVIWTTTNKKIITVKNGKITAVAVGNADVKATAADGSNKKATVHISVKQTGNHVQQPTPTPPATTPASTNQSTNTRAQEPTKAKNVPLQSISLSNCGYDELDLLVDEEHQVNLVLNPSNATVDSSAIEWSSEDPNIVTVSNTGMVKGINEGSTYVDVKVKADGIEFTDSVFVDVSKAKEDMPVDTYQLYDVVTDLGPIQYDNVTADDYYYVHTDQTWEEFVNSCHLKTKHRYEVTFTKEGDKHYAVVKRDGYTRFTEYLGFESKPYYKYFEDLRPIYDEGEHLEYMVDVSEDEGFENFKKKKFEMKEGYTSKVCGTQENPYLQVYNRDGNEVYKLYFVYTVTGRG